MQGQLEGILRSGLESSSVTSLGESQRAGQLPPQLPHGDGVCDTSYNDAIVRDLQQVPCLVPRDT